MTLLRSVLSYTGPVFEANLSDPVQTWWNEMVLAVARLLLAAGGLFAIYVDKSEPAYLAPAGYALLIGYVLFALLTLLFIRAHRVLRRDTIVFIHALSILWVGTISLFTSGPNSAYLVFFFFVILAAAFRWGLRGALLTTVVLVFILLLQVAVMMSKRFAGGIFHVDLAIDNMIMRCVYLLVMGCCAGYLGDKQKESASELNALASLPELAAVDRTIAEALTAVTQKLLQWLKVEESIWIFHDVVKDLWSGRYIRSDGYIAVIREDQARGQFVELSPGAHRTELPSIVLPTNESIVDSFRSFQRRLTLSDSPEGAPSVLVASLEVSTKWEAQIIFPDRTEGLFDTRLLFLSRVARHLRPLIHNIVLTIAQAADATTAERMLIARELHDGAIQSLTGISLQLGAMRGSYTLEEGAKNEMSRILTLIRSEIGSLRNLMHGISTAPSSGRDLLQRLQALASIMTSESGIRVDVIAPETPTSLSPSACRELYRIAQEAVANARSHSGATKVSITLRRVGPRWKLRIEDDGRGFDFEGTLTMRQLDLAGCGPKVIRARAKAANADLSISSSKGNGASVEVSLPEVHQ